MKKSNSVLYLLFLLFVLGESGCIKEDAPHPEGCPPERDKHVLIVRSFDLPGHEITGTGVVKEIVLYIFDNKSNYLNQIQCKESEPVELDYPEHSLLTIVGWGNSSGGEQYLPRINNSASIKDLQIKLKQTQVGYSNSPADLFHGITTIELNSITKTVTHYLDIQRKVASMYISIKGLQAWLDTSDTDFSFEIDEKANAFDFYGSLQGDLTTFRPKFEIKGTDEFVIPIFYTLPSGENPVTLRIRKGNQVIYTTSEDESGNPFRLEPGKLLTVSIDFNAGINSVVSLESWVESDINQEF